MPTYEYICTTCDIKQTCSVPSAAATTQPSAPPVATRLPVASRCLSASTTGCPAKARASSTATGRA